MDSINKVKSISIWVFIVPFVAVNACLLITTQFHSLIEPQYRIFMPFPYIDGGVSISRTARYFPTYLIFKPAMFLTSYLLIIYWLSNKKIIENFEHNHKHKKKIVFFGIASAIALTIHAIFLGVKFDNDLYKLFRRVIMFAFIVFEIGNTLHNNYKNNTVALRGAIGIEFVILYICYLVIFWQF